MPLTPFDPKGYGHPLHAIHLANQLRQVRHRAPKFTRPHVQKGFLLLIRGLVIHIDDAAPVPLQDIAGDVDQDGKGAARDIHAVDRPSVNVPCNHSVAGATIRVFSDPARADRIAGAHF